MKEKSTEGASRAHGKITWLGPPTLVMAELAEVKKMNQERRQQLAQPGLGKIAPLMCSIAAAQAGKPVKEAGAALSSRCGKQCSQQARKRRMNAECSSIKEEYGWGGQGAP